MHSQIDVAFFFAPTGLSADGLQVVVGFAGYNTIAKVNQQSLFIFFTHFSMNL